MTLGGILIGLIRRFLTFLAKMGLSVRDDPRKVVDIGGRQWGQPVNGLALSVLLPPRKNEELPTISVAIHNRSAETQSLTTRGWLDFFRVSIIGPDGVAAPMTSYGAELMKPERLPAPVEVILSPGEAIEADIPIGSIFQMRRGQYRVHVSCDVPGAGGITSNEILLG